MESFDISKLLEEASVEMDALIKSEKAKLESLQKSNPDINTKHKIPDVEESGSAASKMMKDEHSKSHSIPDVEQSGSSAAHSMGGSLSESSSASSGSSSSGSSASGSVSGEMSKDEDSSYESQAPEISDESESGEDLEQMLSGLDDGMLDELEQALQMEKERREHSHSSSSSSDSSGSSSDSSDSSDSSSSSDSSDSSDSSSSSSSSPSESSSSQSAPDLSMAYKAELNSVKEELAKSEAKSEELQKAFNSVTDCLEKMLNRPVVKAITDIREIDYIDKGEKDLKKAEASPEKLNQKMREIAGDYKKFSSLTKAEQAAVKDYFFDKKTTPEVMKIYFK